MNALENGIFTPQKWGRYQISDIRYQISDIRYQISDIRYQDIHSKFSEKYIPAKKFVFSFIMSMMNKKTVFYLCHLFVINNIKINRNKSEKQAAKTPSMSFFSKTNRISGYLISDIRYLISDIWQVFGRSCMQHAE